MTKAELTSLLETAVAGAEALLALPGDPLGLPRGRLAAARDACRSLLRRPLLLSLLARLLR